MLLKIGLWHAKSEEDNDGDDDDDDDHVHDYEEVVAT